MLRNPRWDAGWPRLKPLLNRTPDGYVPTLARQGVREQAERLEAPSIFFAFSELREHLRSA